MNRGDRPRSNRWLVVGGALAAAAVTVALYYAGLDGPFVLDDRQNLALSRLDTFSLDGLVELVRASSGQYLQRPLAYLSFTVTFSLFGAEAFHFKLGNLVIHLLVGGLLYLLGHRLLELLAPHRALGQRRALAGVAATLWLIEPMHVSTVLYTVQRMAQLSALFVTLAVIAYLGLRRALQEGHRRRAVGFAGVLVVATSLGLASKQDAILVPAYILAIEVVAHFTPNAALRDRASTVAAIVFGLLPVVGGAIAALALQDFLLASYDRHSFGVTERLATEARILWDYARQLTLPRLSGFGLFADRFAVSDFTDRVTYAALGGWLIALVAALAVRRHAPIATLGVLWYLTAHTLESSFIGLALAFEHRNYLAAFGITLILAELLTRWSSRGYRGVSTAIGVLLASLFLFQTWARVQTWSDYTTLTRTAVEEHPGSADARAAYARYLFGRGRIDAGMAQLEAGMRNAPDDAGFEVVRLNQACRHGRYRKSFYTEARRALREERISAYAGNALGRLQEHVLRDACKWISESQLLALMDAAVTQVEGRAPKSVRVTLHGRRGQLLANHFGDYEAALKAYQRAAALGPRWASQWQSRVQLHLRLGQVDQARAVLDAMHTRFPLLPPLAPDQVAELRERIDRVESIHQRSATPPSQRS